MKDKWFVLALINTAVFCYLTYHICTVGIEVSMLGLDVTLDSSSEVQISSKNDRGIPVSIDSEVYVQTGKYPLEMEIKR